MQKAEAIFPSATAPGRPSRPPQHTFPDAIFNSMNGSRSRFGNDLR